MAKIESRAASAGYKNLAPSLWPGSNLTGGIIVEPDLNNKSRREVRIRPTLGVEILLTKEIACAIVRAVSPRGRRALKFAIILETHPEEAEGTAL
jgi:hypothetical protein